jgi:hypothetical protein
MNDLAADPNMVRSNGRHQDMAEAEEASNTKSRHFDLAEVSPFLGTDDLILSLFKDYLNAKADYQSALLSHGSNSPLAEIAADHADSAWCALQVRIYELKQSRAATARAEMLERIRKDSFEAEEEKRLRKLREKHEEAYRKTAAKNRQRRNEPEGALLLLILFLLANREGIGLMANWLGPLPNDAAKAGT